MEQTKNQKRGKRPRIDKKDVDENRPSSKMPKVDYTVWDIIMPGIIRSRTRELHEELTSGFKTHSDRIKATNAQTQGMSIAEAFEKMYPDKPKIDKKIAEKASIIPGEIRMGSVVKLNIADVSKKNGVIFESGNYKTSFITRNNLSTIPSIPEEPVSARVIEVRPDCVVVDVITSMLEEFVIPRAARPWIQNTLKNTVAVRVKNLHLVRGGYTGRAVIPGISKFLGRDFEVDAFIPGSQIVLNTTNDFEAFEGKDVDAFIMSYSFKPGTNEMSLVCSAKNLIKLEGYRNLMKIHAMWCDDGQEWDNFSHTPLNGIVTGVINSSKKCGVFVELPELKLTGLISLPADRLTAYPAGTEIAVFFSDLEEELQFNEAAGQLQHLPAFEIEDGAFKHVNVKPVLSLVTRES